MLVTGASSGIGATLATAYGGERANVVATYRSDVDGAKTTVRSVERAGGRAVAVPFDLADPASAAAVVSAVVAHFDHLDVLVANAVVWPPRSPTGRLEDLPEEDRSEPLRANIDGTFALVQAALPHL